MRGGGDMTPLFSIYFNETKRFSSRHALMNVGEEHNIGNLGSIRWHLCLCLLLAWILVVLFVSRGIQSTGKVSSDRAHDRQI